MNMIHRFYCRVIQLAFRAAMPLLPYHQPQLLHSPVDAAQLLRQKDIAFILLIADTNVRRLGLTAPLESALHQAHIAYAAYEQRTPNPTIHDVEQARSLYLNAGAKAIIAVGGGSAIDCAKVVGARIARPGKTISKMRGLLRIMRKTPLLIAVPTTAGTGSETTLSAVITDNQTHHKYPINDFSLIPDYAILDADLTAGLSPFLTVTTGLDALTHAIEAYIGRSTTKLTRAMAEEAVVLITKNLRSACKNGHNPHARSRMLRASYCAGIAFTRSYVGYVHGIAHSLGGQYGIAHGLANAVILPRMLRCYGTSVTGKLAALARKASLASLLESNQDAAERLIRWIEEISCEFGIPKGFSQIREEDIPLMARHAARECNPLYPVPVLMNREELEAIYHKLMHEEETR